VRLRRREDLVECAGRMRRQVVERDPDRLGFGIVDVDKLAHALGEVTGGTMLGDLDLAPRAVDVEQDERLTVPLRLYSQSSRSSCLGRAGIGWRTSPKSWVGLSSKHTSGRFGSGVSA
jgi:hypothetical protein